MYAAVRQAMHTLRADCTALSATENERALYAFSFLSPLLCLANLNGLTFVCLSVRLSVTDVLWLNSDR